MALTLDATVGGVAANSYMTYAEAVALVDEVYWRDPWTAEAQGAREAALVEATRIIDTYEFKGEQSATTQQLQFPRQNLFSVRRNRTYTSAEMPRDLQLGTLELAIAILAAKQAGEDSPFEDGGENVVENITLGPLGIKLNDVKTFVTIGLHKFPRVTRILSDLMRGGDRTRLVSA